MGGNIISILCVIEHSFLGKVHAVVCAQVLNSIWKQNRYVSKKDVC